MSKALAKKDEGSNVPAELLEAFKEDVGQGFEETDQQSFAIPFLVVLQANSPQCKRSDGSYIPGAIEGMFFNTATEELFDGEKGITVCPAHFKRVYTEWTGTKDEGGTFAGEHDVATGEEILRNCHRDEDGNDRTEDGHIIVDGRNHYLILVKEDGTFEPVLLSLTSTQIKKSKKWVTQMKNIHPVMSSQMWKLTTVGESKDKYTWSGIKVEHIGMVQSMAVYQAAKEFHEMVRSGKAVASNPGTPLSGDDLPY